MTLKEDINDLDNSSGVYCIYDVDEKPAYVGKTTNGIKNRLRQHFISQTSSLIGHGRLDVWDVYYVEYWKTDNTDDAEKQLISQLKPYLNLGGLGETHEVVNPNSPSGKLQVISKEEAKSRKEPYNRAKQKITHIDRMLDKIKKADHGEDVQKVLYEHLDLLEDNLDEFLDVKD
ncbi:MAG: GIY-YIG nuclease family protein [Candidatus Nanohaloarchaea archaeon]